MPSVIPKNTRQTVILCRVYFGKTLEKPLFLLSVKFDTRQKKVVYRVFFQNTLGIGLLFAECFWELHSANLFFKEKNNFFLSISVHLLHNSRENLILSKLEKKYLTSCLEKIAFLQASPKSMVARPLK